MEERNEIVINYSSKADKFFVKHKSIKEKFIENITKLIDGIEVDVKELKGYKFLYHMRIGKYRVIYTIVNDEITIINVLNAESRGDVYKHL